MRVASGPPPTLFRQRRGGLTLWVQTPDRKVERHRKGYPGQIGQKKRPRPNIPLPEGEGGQQDGDPEQDDLDERRARPLQGEKDRRPHHIERELESVERQRARIGRPPPFSPYQPGRYRHREIEQSPDDPEQPVGGIPGGFDKRSVPGAWSGRRKLTADPGGGYGDYDRYDQGRPRARTHLLRWRSGLRLNIHLLFLLVWTGRTASVVPSRLH